MELTAKPKRQAFESVLSRHTATNSISAIARDDLMHEGRQYMPPNPSNTLIATLWVQLTDIYGARFVNAYGERDSSGVWYQALSELTEDDFRQGLYLMMRDTRFETWPPNCTQFRQLCLVGKKQSLPSVHKAFAEARQNAYYATPTWSHPAVKFTVKYVGVDVVNSAYELKAYEQFLKGYAKVCARIAKGYVIPDVSDEEVAYYHGQKTRNSISHIKNNKQTLRSLLHATNG